MLEAFTIPDDGPSSLEAALVEMTNLATDLDGGSIRLYSDPDFEPGAATDAATMNAVQSVFGGYTAGGIAIADVPEPYIAEDNLSYLLTLVSVQWNATGVGDPAQVDGAYILDADGKLRGVRKFSEPKIMGTALDSLPVVVTFRKS
jgi:hypothetical protein